MTVAQVDGSDDTDRLNLPVNGRSSSQTSATYRSPQSRHRQSSQDHLGQHKSSDNPYKDQEFFGQHILKSRRENCANQSSESGRQIMAAYDQDQNQDTTHRDANYVIYHRNIHVEHLNDHHIRDRREHDQQDDEQNCDTYGESDQDQETSEEAPLVAVASAEEYAAKIIKLQQACLIPLKEDLADWLNKILKTSQITTGNFMDKLDNGVIICRLAKVISLWCQQQLADQDNNGAIGFGADRVPNVETIHGRPSSRSRFPDNAVANLNLHSPLRTSATSQSANCLIKTSASATSLNNGSHLSYHSNHFINNLIRMYHIKIWEDARCRTFYARDNVCNFIKWSKDFGVNRSVLFESDDLVLHANPRQVVLCLLDVARIAYVKYGFTEAPGLVKFEQEIDRELASERYVYETERVNYCEALNGVNGSSCDTIRGSLNKNAPIASARIRTTIGDATDELVMRYCRHKEEEAARKRQQEELEKSNALQHIGQPTNSDAEFVSSTDDKMNSFMTPEIDSNGHKTFEPDSLMPNPGEHHFGAGSEVTSSSDLRLLSTGKNRSTQNGGVASIDSGEGPTESASTVEDSINRYQETSVNDRQTQVSSAMRTNADDFDASSPIPASHPTTTSNSVTEDLSSSRSSLSSNQDCKNDTSHYGRPITSDLDGKVMRIAKSYYGKKASKDVTRLSEGKYKIADRIVFVRLLKGHRVMVRIGGGWDTLENFLFRHKSDPTQVIDPDNLLPLETKISLEKSAQTTPRSTPLRSPGATKLPNYRRSNSTSSTNLSLSNLSYSNLSIASSRNITTPSRQIPTARLNKTMIGCSNAYSSSPAVDQSPKRQIPCLMVHKGQPVSRASPRHQHAIYAIPLERNGGELEQQLIQNQQTNLPQITKAQITSTPNKSALLRKTNNHSNSRIPSHQRLPTTPMRSTSAATKSIYIHRPLASSKAPTFSVTNLYPATLTANSNRSKI